jgi:hypothetical protein
MALIEITVDNPALIRTGEEQAERVTTGTDEETTDADAGEVDTDEETDLINTIGTFVTALSALAGVLRQLRSEEEEGAAVEAGTESDVEAGGDADDGFEEIDEIDEIGGPDEIDDTEDESLETGLEGEDESEEDAEAEASGSGLGTKVAILLVVALVVAALWLRGGDEGDEESEFEV